MPLVFWAAQTMAAYTLLGVGEPKPLRDEDDDSTSTSSPLLLSNQEAATPIAGDTANATSGSSFVTQNEMSAFSSVLLTVSSIVELVSSRMDDVSSRMTKIMGLGGG